jgi:hexosaminidase
MKLAFIWIKKYVVDLCTRTMRTYFPKTHYADTAEHSFCVIPEPYESTYNDGVYKRPEAISVTLSEYRDLFVTLIGGMYPYTFAEYGTIECRKEILKDTHAYSIVISTEKIILIYQDEQTFRYAVSTLTQLLQKEEIPTGTIYDFPAYSWRGLNLDVARHFMPISFIKEVIRKMYLQKLNILHIHLTDDQGWRFESKLYPKLHTLGSKRRETVIGNKLVPFIHMKYAGDGIPHEGFYTQESLRELVEYAHTYGVEIVPEIDIPGHGTALLVVYPEHAAHVPPKEVETDWGVFHNMLSPEEKTITFLQNIFKELSEVFPGPYIHIGGDEVPLDAYKKSTAVKKLVQEGKLTSYKDAPAYILTAIAAYLKSIGRTPVMWDEASDIAQETGGIIMVWRDMSIMHAMVEKQIPHICTTASHLYFDHYQHPNTKKEPLAIGGYSPIDYVYDAPVIANHYLLGMQANMWTEYTKTPEAVRYMLFPRTYALADIAWGKYHANLKTFLGKVQHLWDFRK